METTTQTQAPARKIGLKQGLVLAAFCLAFTAGLGFALHSAGRDPWQAADMFVPLFVGALIASSGLHPARSPKLLATVVGGAVGLMMLTQWATPMLRASA
ncbi:hypothetical protein [Cognatilysobacter bugurensis]|uniref:Uncharacterized protein n=1 Tax=Cognatilysobacter bugurensis TaxID=543356 RepID=A0A918SVJ0_9GAMM|nr:hypothetical protein [Lysobacter bugurensis]GHA74003.1 hypothetical protein GCM10007067_08630 [Lysobacter bugurensis]